MPQCNNSSTASAPAATLRLRSHAALIAILMSFFTLALAQEPNDTRQVYSPESPSWLQAVGKLTVPGSRYTQGRRRHLFEDCSATLVTHSRGRAADTIVTAWHCLENYNDLSKPIVFTLLPGEHGSVEREAYRLVDGGGMHADWALLRLRSPIPYTSAAALLVDPGRANPDQTISMAGYSRDQEKGAGGARLTFDPACLITAQTDDLSDSNCLAHKGASGGAVVQVSAAGTAQLCGVVSEGNGAGISTFVPVSAFRRSIGQHLN